MPDLDMESGNLRREKRPANGGDSELEQLLRRVIRDEIGERVTALENTTRNHEDRLTKVEQQLLSRGTPAASAWPTSGIGEQPTRSGTSSSFIPSGISSGINGFTPSFLELRGWCSWEEREEKGVRRVEDVEPFMRGLLEHLPQGYHKYIGAPRLFGAKNVKLQLPIEPGMAWELRGVIRDAILHGDLKLRGIVPRVTVEDSPGVKLQKVTMGKLMDACKALITQKGLHGWTVTPEWRDQSVYMKSEGAAGSVRIGYSATNGAPIFEEGGIRKVFGLEQAAFERAFLESRRR